MAFKQRHAKTIFQLSDLSADGARRHPEPVSGNLETPSPGGFGKGTQGVQWLVLANPIYAEAEDIQAFKDLEGDNFRPVQRINGRIVTQRYCGLSCE